MKISKTVGPLLLEGDRVVASVTHEIKINGDKSWVRYEAESRVQAGEDPAAAAARVQDHVDLQVMETVKKTVTSVNSVG